MSINVDQMGGLYDDERTKSLLNPLAQKKFDEYQEKLATLSKIVRKNGEEDSSSTALSSWQIWENGIRQIYKEMIYDAFKAFGTEMPKDMEVHFAGSLAKAQATEYSDLDAFVIVKDEKDIAKVKPVFDGLNNLCQRIYTASRQLYPDPIGINPSRLMGTPESLFKKLKDEDVSDVEVTTCSILTSKPVLPRYELGEELRDKIRKEPYFSHFVSAKQFYNRAIHEYPGPKEGAEEINVKSHIMRPIDFILMGLREEFNLYSEDGAHLSAPGTIRLLREEKLLPEEEISRIESVYNQAMTKRFRLHNVHKKEHDNIPLSQAKQILVEVEKIRELARQRVAKIENLENAKNLPETRHVTKDEGRKHTYTASTETFPELKNQYKGLQGDALKMQILTNFKNELAKATDLESLSKIAEQLKARNEYKILLTGQSRITRFLGLDTSSISTFEKLVEKAEEKILLQFQPSRRF